MKRNTTKCRAQREVRLKMNRRLAAGQSSWQKLESRADEGKRHRQDLSRTLSRQQGSRSDWEDWREDRKTKVFNLWAGISKNLQSNMRQKVLSDLVLVCRKTLFKEEFDRPGNMSAFLPMSRMRRSIPLLCPYTFKKRKIKHQGNCLHLIFEM